MERQSRVFRQVIVEAGDNDIPDLGFASQPLNNRIVPVKGEYELGSRVRQLVFHFHLLEARVRRKDDHSQSGSGDIGDTPLRAVIGVQEGSIPLFVSHVRKGRGESIRGLIPLFKSQFRPVKVKRDPVGCFPGMPLYTGRNRDFTIGEYELPGHAGRPVFSP